MRDFEAQSRVAKAMQAYVEGAGLQDRGAVDARR